MGFDLAHLITNTRRVTVHSQLFGVDVEVEYAPGEYTGEAYAAYRAALEKGEATEAFKKVLTRLIREWDVTNNGKKLPVNAATFDLLPIRLTGELFSAIMDDMNPKEAESSTIS
jgi:hypothetical protein